MPVFIPGPVINQGEPTAGNVTPGMITTNVAAVIPPSTAVITAQATVDQAASTATIAANTPVIPPEGG